MLSAERAPDATAYHSSKFPHQPDAPLPLAVAIALRLVQVRPAVSLIAETVGGAEARTDATKTIITSPALVVVSETLALLPLPSIFAWPSSASAIRQSLSSCRH